MVGKIISNKYGLLIVGLIILGIGIFLMGQTEVKCGDSTMRPGATCTTVSKGSSTERTYEEQKSFSQRINIIIAGIGGVMTLGGAGWIVSSLVRRKPVAAQ